LLPQFRRDFLLLDGMRRIRTAIERDYWEISRKAQESVGLTPIIPSYMQDARND
jgi:predicted permease